MSSSLHFYIGIIWILSAFCIRHAEAAVICGNLGSIDSSVTTFYMGNFFFKAPSTFAFCGDFCKVDSRCRSFRYSYFADADAQYCEFFSLYS